MSITKDSTSSATASEKYKVRRGRFSIDQYISSLFVLLL